MKGRKFYEKKSEKPVALLTAALTAASLLADGGSPAGESTDAGAQVEGNL